MSEDVSTVPYTRGAPSEEGREAVTRRAAFGWAAASAAGSALLAGCGPLGQSRSSQTSPGGRPFVTLEYWTFMGTEARVPARKELFPEYEVKFNTRVEITHEGGLETKMLAGGAAGVLPDLVDPNIPSNLNDFARQGLLEPVDHLLAALGRDDFYEPARRAGTLDGKLYGIPYIGWPHVLYYRSDWYRRRGLKEPPKTWDDLVRNAQALHGISPDSQETAGFGGFYGKGQGPMFWQDFVGPNGGETFNRRGQLNVNTPNVLEMLVLVERLVPVTQAGADNAGYSGNNTLFTQGKLAHHISSTSFAEQVVRNAPDLAPQIGAVPIPQGTRGKGDRGAYNGISYMSYTKLSKQKDRSEEFLKWFFSKEIHLRLFTGIDRGLLPMRNSVGKSAEYQNYPHLQSVKPLIVAGVQAQPIATLVAEDYGPNPLAAKLIETECHAKMMRSVYLRQAGPRQALETGEACMRGVIQTYG